MTSRALNLVLALLIGLAALGCAKSETPEQRVRALLADAEEAAEKRDLAKLRGYISPHYKDEDGRDRHAMDGILRLYLLRNDGIHMTTRIESVIAPQPQRVEAVVYVAMAARPVKSADELRSFNTQLYRFELGFAEEHKTWRVVRAAWRPTALTDFFP